MPFKYRLKASFENCGLIGLNNVQETRVPLLPSVALHTPLSLWQHHQHAEPVNAGIRQD